MKLLRSCFLISLFSAAFVFPITIHAQEQIIEQPIEFSFNQEITFRAIFQSESPPDLAVIFFQEANDHRTVVELAEINNIKTEEYEIKHVHHLESHNFRAFSSIEYRFEIKLRNGGVFNSPIFEFFYSDNRFEWENLQEGPFIVYWYDGDYAFAQSALDIAQEGLEHISGILPLETPDHLSFYMYPDSKAMQEAISPSGEEWVAGHANPDLQTIILYLPPGPNQTLDMKQRIPHEIMHVLLFHSDELGYQNLPVWLTEGLASIAELYPNPDYRILLDNAAALERMIPMASLCETFPRDASSALLAYAQSAAFTNYIYSSYGTSGLERLLENYTGGMDCENGAESALGAGLQQLERRWLRNTLAQNPAETVIGNFLPWLILFAAMLFAPIVFLLRNITSKPGAVSDEGYG